MTTIEQEIARIYKLCDVFHDKGIHLIFTVNDFRPDSYYIAEVTHNEKLFDSAASPQCQTTAIKALGDKLEARLNGKGE